jgi:hypothetical protein
MWRERCRDLAARAGHDADELVEWWAERAAIREVDGNQPRGDAERDAYAELAEALASNAFLGASRRGPRSAEPRAPAVTVLPGTRAKPR